jgi:hypothetical protein
MEPLAFGAPLTETFQDANGPPMHGLFESPVGILVCARPNVSAGTFAKMIVSGRRLAGSAEGWSYSLVMNPWVAQPLKLTRWMPSCTIDDG